LDRTLSGIAKSTGAAGFNADILAVIEDQMRLLRAERLLPVLAVLPEETRRAPLPATVNTGRRMDMAIGADRKDRAGLKRSVLARKAKPAPEGACTARALDQRIFVHHQRVFVLQSLNRQVRSVGHMDMDRIHAIRATSG